VSESSPLIPGGVLEAALYAPDLHSAEQFYRDVLGLQVIGRQPGRHVFFRCGQTVLLLFDPAVTTAETVFIGGRAIQRHGTQGAGHVAFAVDPGSLSAWREHLRRMGVPIDSEIVWPQGGRSIYFRDPAGNSLELATRSIWPQLTDGSNPAP
jgi:catechol 2,3-dioxygenase-like lactoylglutathione lyase family enzyme